MVHHLTQQLRCEELWMICEHYFFLNASREQCPASYKFVGEICLKLAVIIFNACVIFLESKVTHGCVFIFIDDIFDFSVLDLSMDAHLLVKSFSIIDLSLNILYYSLSFILFLAEDEREIHQIIEFASLRDITIKLLTRRKAQHH